MIDNKILLYMERKEEKNFKIYVRIWDAILVMYQNNLWIYVNNK